MFRSQNIWKIIQNWKIFSQPNLKYRYDYWTDWIYHGHQKLAVSCARNSRATNLKNKKEKWRKLKTRHQDKEKVTFYGEMETCQLLSVIQVSFHKRPRDFTVWVLLEARGVFFSFWFLPPVVIRSSPSLKIWSTPSPLLVHPWFRVGEDV